MSRYETSGHATPRADTAALHTTSSRHTAQIGARVTNTSCTWDVWATDQKNVVSRCRPLPAGRHDPPGPSPRRVQRPDCGAPPATHRVASSARLQPGFLTGCADAPTDRRKHSQSDGFLTIHATESKPQQRVERTAAFIPWPCVFFWSHWSRFGLEHCLGAAALGDGRFTRLRLILTTREAKSQFLSFL